MKQIGGGRCPREARAMAPADAVALVQELTDRALPGEFEPVACLEARSGRRCRTTCAARLDGRSVYTRPGTQRYATRVQLSREERLLAHAQREGAPRLTREDAARLLGADACTDWTRSCSSARRTHAQRMHRVGAAPGPGRRAASRR